MGLAHVLIPALAGCGRIGFDASVGDASTPDGSGFVHSELALAPPQAPLTDFPLLVTLTNERIARDRLGDGSDLRFVDADGTPLAYELEQLGNTNNAPLIAWVRVPTIEAGTTIEVRYGGDTGPAATRSVWTDEFAAVWHFAGDSTSDSSGHGLDAVATGTRTAEGRIGTGRSFESAAKEYMTVAGGQALGYTAFTVSGWIQPRSIPGGFFGMITRQVGDTSDNDLYLGLVQAAAVVTCETASGEHDASNGTVAIAEWHYLTGVATSSIERVYLDGVQVAQGPIDGALTPSDRPIFLGADRSSGGGVVTVPTSDFVDGILDELRIQVVARPAAWIEYDARAQRDDAITYGAITGA